MKIQYGKATEFIIGFGLGIIALVMAYGQFSGAVVTGIISFILLVLMSTMLLFEILLERAKGKKMKDLGAVGGILLLVCLGGYVLAFITLGYYQLPPSLTGLAAFLYIALAVGIFIEMFKR